MGLSKKTRFEVFKRDGFKCQYCGRSAPDVILQVDHIEPQAKGGGHNVINLVTSCADCNLGKSDRMLSDGQIVEAQRRQLQELSERREQLKMMAKWQKEMMNLEDEQVALLEEVWKRAVPYEWTPSGRDIIKRTLKRFGFCETSAAIGTATSNYLVFEDGKPTMASAVNALGKIGGVAYLNTLDGDEKEIRHIANILTKRTHYSTKWKLWELLRQQKVDHPSIPWNKIRALAGGCSNFGDFEAKLEALNGAGGVPCLRTSESM